MRTIVLTLFILCVSGLKAQSGGKKIIAGVVTNDMGREMLDVHVVSKKQGFGTITDKNGSFKISIESPDTLVFIYIGCKERIFVLYPESDPIQFINIMMESSSVVLNEVKISPYLSKQALSYKNLPMDASETNRYYLKQLGMRGDKTYFDKVGVDLATLLPVVIGMFKRKPSDPSDPSRKLRIYEMKRLMVEKGDSAFQNTISMDSLKHPSRAIFIRE